MRQERDFDYREREREREIVGQLSWSWDLFCEIIKRN